MKETPRKIIRNTLINSLSFVFIFVTNLFILPFVVHSLGNELYGGVWVIIGTLTAYIGLLDIGTGTAFVKFISEYHAKHEEKNLLEVVNTGLLVYVLIGVVILAMTFFFGERILALAGVPSHLHNDGIFVLQVGMLIFVVTNVLSPLTSIVTGIQRMDVSAAISVASQALSVAGTVAVLSMGFGIRGLILNNLLVAVVSSLSLTYYAFRFVPWLTLHPRLFAVSKVKQFISYGMNLQVSRFAHIMLFQTDRVICLKFFGTLATTLYDLGGKLNNITRTFPLMLISALVPAVAEIGAKEQREHLLQLYRRGSKYLAMTAVLFSTFLFFFAPDIMKVWMGEQYVSSADYARILVVGYFFNIITGVASSMTAGLGKTEFDRKTGILVSPFNLAVTLMSAYVFGSIGIAIGTTVSLVVSSLYFLRMFHIYFQIPLGEIAGVYVKPILIASVSIVAAKMVSFIGATAMTGRTSGIIVLILIFFFYCCVYVVGLVSVKAFDEYDRQIVNDMKEKSLRFFQPS